jgi:hypothetical protein
VKGEEGGEKTNRKIILTATLFLIAAMLATPLASAKPEVWSVDFELQTLPYYSEDADWSKFKEFQTEKGMLVVDHIPAIGEVVLEIDNGEDPSYTMNGVVTQMVLCSKLYLNDDPMKVMGNEKWTFTFDDAEASTLEVSANFWIDDLTTQPNGGGTCVGTHGTGVFEDAIFKGAFTTVMILMGPGEGILKIQFGSGEIMFT